MSKESEEATIKEIKPEPCNPQPNEKPKANEDGFARLLEAVLPLADKYLTFKENESNARIKYFERASKHNRNMLYVMTIFLAAVIGFMSWLTYSGIVSGDALLFLVGTVTGYILLFIKGLVSPTEEEPIEEIS